MAKIDKSENIHFDISQIKLGTLLNKLKDLSKINEKKIVVFKFEKKHLALFSFVGKNFKNIYAFKSYIFEYDDLFEYISEIKNPIAFISKNGVHLYHTLNQFVDYKESISFNISISSRSIGFADLMNITNNILDINMPAGDDLMIGKNISIEDIEHIMNSDNCLFKFKLHNSEYEKIKKMSTIVIKENDIINITIENNFLYFGENRWKLKICEIDQADYTYTFPKRYFNTISTTTDIDIAVFETYILCKYEEYNLMVVLETSI
jgi:hypothetical protein